jgi:hypothetical protein
VPHKRAVEHDDDEGELAEPVTATQRQELFERSYKGAFPSTRVQAEAILERLRSAPVTET